MEADQQWKTDLTKNDNMLYFKEVLCNKINTQRILKFLFSSRNINEKLKNLPELNKKQYYMFKKNYKTHFFLSVSSPTQLYIYHINRLCSIQYPWNN